METSDKIFFFVMFGLLSILALSSVLSFLNPQQKQSITPEVNYRGLAMLHLAPDSPSRQPTDKDYDTKLNLVTEKGETYRLFESRDIKSYGKTFVVRVA